MKNKGSIILSLSLLCIFISLITGCRPCKKNMISDLTVNILDDGCSFTNSYDVRIDGALIGSLGNDGSKYFNSKTFASDAGTHKITIERNGNIVCDLGDVILLECEETPVNCPCK